MKKRIIIEVETDEEDEKIIYLTKLWVKDSYQRWKESDVKVEEIK